MRWIYISYPFQEALTATNKKLSGAPVSANPYARSVETYARQAPRLFYWFSFRGVFFVGVSYLFVRLLKRKKVGTHGVEVDWLKACLRPSQGFLSFILKAFLAVPFLVLREARRKIIGNQEPLMKSQYGYQVENCRRTFHQLKTNYTL